MKSSLEKRISKIEQRHNPKPVSIFADWCIARNPDWIGTDERAFTEWLEFQQTATPDQYQDEQLNPDVGDFSAGLGSNSL